MKKFFLTFALIAIAATAWADSEGSKPSYSGFVSNGFWDNWEISVGVGFNTSVTNGKDLGALGQRIGFNGQVSATKWAHPVFGLRLELQGGQFATFDPTWGKQKWPYIFLHSDLMVNFSNWIGGYRADRVYSAIPHVGFGYMATNFTSSSKQNNHVGMTQNFAFNYGLLNKFRLSPAFDFDLELKGLLVPSLVAPSQLSGGYLFGFSATVGFTYRFKQRGWERSGAGYTADQVRAFQDAVVQGQVALDDAKADNTRLNKDLEAARAEADAAKAAADKVAKTIPKATTEVQKYRDASPLSWAILYHFGETELSEKEQTRLSLVLDRIQNGPKERVYTIEGHADNQTGSAGANQLMSERRAKNVYNYLVGKGIDPKQLKCEGLGSTKNPYTSPQANRLVIIK